MVKVFLILAAFQGFLSKLSLAQYYPFCNHGIQTPHLLPDNGTASVDVILVQAPLFSTNPKIGQKLGAFGLYHTGIVLSQRYQNCSFEAGCREVRQNWTLEFDYTGGNVLSTLKPKIVGDKLQWGNEVGFCLTEGILWGREHWTHSFDTVAHLTAEQVQATFQEVVLPVNSSKKFRPQYQLWRVVKGGWLGKEPASTFVQDVTCADGVRWFLHYISNKAGARLYDGFALKATAVLVDADHVEVVDTTNEREWSEVFTYYKRLSELFENVSTVEKIIDLIRLIPAKYVYDTNADVYYRLIGNHFPWARPRFIVDPLTPPPTLTDFHALPPSQRVIV